jgi:hypothetical protein
MSDTLLGLIGRKTVRSVSFALFGTVLLRRCVGVEGVYERALAHAKLPQRIKDMAESFIQHRVLAQNKLRINPLGARMDDGIAQLSGVTIAAIYDQFAVHALNLPRAVRPRLVEAELLAEQDLAMVNPDVLPLIEEARRLGRRVGIVAESHWSAAQIGRLLGKVAPNLIFDFVVSSADGGDLFRTYLAQQDVKPSEALHIGIDEDTIRQPTAGIALAELRQPGDAWGDLYKREEIAVRMLSITDRGLNWRQDGGLQLIRRRALDRLNLSQTHHLVGANVMGPAMIGFQHHVERRVAELTQPGRQVRVLFLARDGYLPLRVWQAAAGGSADYVEINRRIAMIAGSEGAGGFETVQGLIGGMAHVRAESIEDFFKIKLTKKVRAFFADCDDGLATGADFAAAMPKLLGRKTLGKLSKSLRDQLLVYLDAKLGGLAGCTDMVLVDIGYTGNIQKGLRRVFDVAGLKIRLHGLYLMPQGESFAELPGEDTVSGYFDDTVMTPAVKRAVMRDAPLLEEFCCAPVGSARGYDGVKEVREPEVRLPHEIAFCLEMQDECVRFHDAFRAECRRHGIDPLADFETYRAWTAAILSRFVMMPTPLECQTFGPLLHDVSLGSRGLIATITTADIRNLMGMLPFPAVCSIHHPPVWLGGSLTAHAPVAGFVYAMTGYALPTDNILKDVEIDGIDVAILKDDQAIPVPAAAAVTPFGDLRLRIPVLKKDGASIIAVPLKGPLSRGLIRSFMLQGGADIADATTTRNGERQSRGKIQALRATLDGNFFRAVEADAFLLLPVPAFRRAVSVVTLLVTPLLDH